MLFGRRRGGTLVGGAEALVAAGVLEDTAALDAIEALVAAGLTNRAMVEAALEGEPATVATGQSTDGDHGG